MRSIPHRTATSIRSMANKRIGHRASPRRKYVRLAKIEFEKEHRITHLAQAMERAKECENRLAEIDREQALLLASIDATRKGNLGPSGVPRRAHPAAPGRPGRTPCVLKY